MVNTKPMTNRLGWWWLWGSCLLAGGCAGAPRYHLVPVRGTLKVDGEPAGRFLVQFMPDASQGSAGPTSVGVTDESGYFELETVEQEPGAAVGSHVVVLYDLDEDRPEQGEESTKPARLSSAYSTEQGGVQVTVAKGEPILLDIPSVSPLDAASADAPHPDATPDLADSVSELDEFPTEIRRDRK